jgi:trehalose 6-phosphate synthase/phosphatase
LSGAVIVNPWNTHKVAESIYEAITMSEEEKKIRFDILYRYINTHSAARWGESFIKELERTSRAVDALERSQRSTKVIPPCYETAQKRVLIFSSDGALISYSALPSLAAPSRRVTDLLRRLSQDPRNSVYIVSGRGNYLMIRVL